MKKTYK